MRLRCGRHSTKGIFTTVSISFLATSVKFDFARVTKNVDERNIFRRKMTPKDFDSPHSDGGEFDIGQTPGDIVPGEIKPDFTGD